MLTSYTGETGDDFNAFMAQRAGEEEQKAAGNTQDLKGIVDGILAKNVSTMNQQLVKDIKIDDHIELMVNVDSQN